MNPQRDNLRVVVVDDSTLYRKIVRDVLASLPGVEVVGAASDGQQALEQIHALKPDLVTLDFEMPRLNGVGVLKAIAGKPDAPAAIMVSAFTAAGATATTDALAEGAFDFILKPNTKSLEASVDQLRKDLTPKLHAVRLRSRGTSGQRGAVATRRVARPAPPSVPRRTFGGPTKPKRVIAIAVSTGGPQALTKLLPQFPASTPCPIVIVQHMPPMFTASLAADLDRRCPLSVVEGAHGMPVQRGSIYIAPGGKQMRVAGGENAVRLEITNDPPERNCKPAADYLFRSVADTYGDTAAAVVLTGMGDDGTRGSESIKQKGGVVIAQDEASCVVYGMPKSVVDAGHVDLIAPLSEVAKRVLHVTEGGVLR
ncbi:MAG: chemotaxis-specific protein-glutamate methyltransferase CheB [Planctomycetota bacterium]